MGPPTCNIANADDIRETSISVFQSAILPADGMMAAGRPRRRLRHAPFGSSPHHTRLPLDVEVADLGEKFTSRIFAELHCTELSRRTIEVGHERRVGRSGFMSVVTPKNDRFGDLPMKLAAMHVAL